jgi:hypothetical protein
LGLSDMALTYTINGDCKRRFFTSLRLRGEGVKDRGFLTKPF